MVKMHRFLVGSFPWSYFSMGLARPGSGIKHTARLGPVFLHSPGPFYDHFCTGLSATLVVSLESDYIPWRKCQAWAMLTFFHKILEIHQQNF